MTDLEKFISLYKSFGIECVVNQESFVDEGKFYCDGYIINLSADCYDEEGITINSKLVGYHGFYSNIRFDNNGNFIDQGFWE